MISLYLRVPSCKWDPQTLQEEYKNFSQRVDVLLELTVGNIHVGKNVDIHLSSSKQLVCYCGSWYLLQSVRV